MNSQFSILNSQFLSLASRLRETLTLVLIAALPFHALLVTVSTRVLAGPDRAPLSVLALWKEGLLGVILLIAGMEIVNSLRIKIGQRSVVSSPATSHPLLPRFDSIDILILLLALLSVAVTAATHGDWSLYLFGFRYDFVPLVSFFILRRAVWSEDFLPRALQTILWSGMAVASYALISFVLPAGFFRWLGYSDLHSLYVPGRPVAPFQLIGETGLRRVQGPMSGPNQLGIWLLLPIAICIARIAASRSWNTLHLWLLALLSAALLLTFSRAAWIAAFVIGCVGFAPVVRSLPRRMSVAAALVMTVLIVILASLFPSVIVRLSSTRGHVEGPIEALQYMITQPFGRGMGMAGPASNRVSDACVLLRETDDPAWAEAHPNLCVFLGDVQVQPVDHACVCPFLPENWFLQIGVEMGWIGMGMYLLLILLIFMRLRMGCKTQDVRLKSHEGGEQLAMCSLYLAFIGVCVAALFLHAFEDAAASYTLWVLAAAAVSYAQTHRRYVV